MTDGTVYPPIRTFLELKTETARGDERKLNNNRRRKAETVV